MPKWIHDRAEHIRGKNPDMDEGMSYALATQQAHKLGKSPKTFKSKATGKKERFGTPEGRREAKKKFDKPLKEYRKTAGSIMDTAPDTNETQTTGGEQPHLNPQTDPSPPESNDVPAVATAASKGSQHWDDAAKLLDNLGEKPTFQREHVVSNPTADKPNVPNIKVANDVMWGSFFDELQKIAAKTPKARGLAMNLQKPSGILMRARKLLTGKATGKKSKIKQILEAEGAG